MAPAKVKNNCLPASDCWVSFEDYLKPKKKQQPLILDKQKKVKRRTELRLKLLEHPILIAGHKSKYMHLKEKILKIITKTRLNVSYGQLNIWRFLSFLHARKDEHICKRKSGFEIYCEIASIHGFKNFVGATTLQRAFWFLIILLAVIMSGSVLLVSHFMNVQTPTILYSQNTLYPNWDIAFPAVTICNINRISKIKAERLARSFRKPTNLTVNELINYFKLALFSTENIKADAREYKFVNNILKVNNFTVQRLLDEIEPDCLRDLLKCSFAGKYLQCGYVFRQIQTSFGQCCTFNYGAIKEQSNAIADNELLKISNCGSINGLSIVLHPHLDDYKASSFLAPGFRVFVHDAFDTVDQGTASQRIITTSTVNRIRVWPYHTYATEHISSLDVDTRKCYLLNERELFYYGAFSLENCLAECRSLMFFEKCNCVPPYRPRKPNWTICGLEDTECYFKYKYLLTSTLKDFNSARHEDKFICNCYPLCDFTQYIIDFESGQLSRKYSLTDKRLFEGINITDHMLLRVFLSELHTERLSLDVSENWLSFLGNFGGITGLYMGYSFLSGFELIFFIVVRPACNWWTKRCIKKRIKKRIKEREQK